MTYSYKTIDYLKDNFWFIDLLHYLFQKIVKKILLSVHKLFNLELESHLIRILENLPYGIFIIFLGFFFTVYLIRVTESEKGIKVFTITTGSMSPVVKPGSLLFSWPQEKYGINDIVNYKEINLKIDEYTGRVLTHRIIDRKVERGYYIYTLKGDNNNNPDPGEIRTSDITGKVFLILPYLGYIDFIIRTIPGFIIFILIPSVLLVREAKRYLAEK